MNCAGRLRLKKELQRERDLLLCAAKVDAGERPELLEEMLEAIYRRLRGTKPPGRFGAHWQEVGFQGRDPASDLRSTGLLGALMALFFVERYQRETIGFLNFVAETAGEDFPLAVTLVQFALFALKALRQGRLTEVANRDGGLLRAFNDFYAASLFELFAQLRRAGGSIMSYPPVRKQTQEDCLRSAKALVHAFRQRPQRRND